MMTLFSLADDSYYLEFPCAGPFQLSRRTASVETLDGGQARDFGPAEAGVKLSAQTGLSDRDVSALYAAVEAGTALGVSHGAGASAVKVSRIQSMRTQSGRNDVALEFMTAGKI